MKTLNKKSMISLILTFCIVLIGLTLLYAQGVDRGTTREREADAIIIRDLKAAVALWKARAETGGSRQLPIILKIGEIKELPGGWNFGGWQMGSIERDTVGVRIFGFTTRELSQIKRQYDDMIKRDKEDAEREAKIAAALERGKVYCKNCGGELFRQGDHGSWVHNTFPKGDEGKESNQGVRAHDDEKHGGGYTSCADHEAKKYTGKKSHHAEPELIEELPVPVSGIVVLDKGLQDEDKRKFAIYEMQDSTKHYYRNVNGVLVEETTVEGKAEIERQMKADKKRFEEERIKN